MSKVKVPKIPSLQHLARTWDPDQEKIRRTLVALAKNSPTFSYQLMYELVQDLVHSKIPFEQIEFAIRSRIKREGVRNNYLEILALVQSNFESLRPSFIQRVTPRYYPLGRGLFVPFSPPFVYGLDGVLHMPWFSFWRSNPLSGTRLRLFSTVVNEILSQDPDLDNAQVTVLDFSAPESSAPRELSEHRLMDVELLSKKDVADMLKIYMSGFDAACRDLASSDFTLGESDDGLDGQYSLFD